MTRISFTHREEIAGLTDVTSPSEHIIEKFGGLTKLARARGVPVSTVQGWKERGKIPQDHWFPIIEAGKDDGIAIAIEDFVQAPSSEAAA